MSSDGWNGTADGKFISAARRQEDLMHYVADWKTGMLLLPRQASRADKKYRMAEDKGRFPS
jgi:hypothetical protein